MARLTTKMRKEMPAKEFAGGKGGKAGDTGRFPLNDKKRIAAAESYERYATPAEKKKIDAAANKAFGPKNASGERSMPSRGERTMKNKAKRGGDMMGHPATHDEWEKLGND